MKCFYHADADGKCAGFWVALNVGINDNYVPEICMKSITIYRFR